MKTTNIEISETGKSINWQVARGCRAHICIRKGRRMRVRIVRILGESGRTEFRGPAGQSPRITLVATRPEEN